MIEPAYHFCPQCGKPLHVAKRGPDEFQTCDSGHQLYKNQNVCVAGVILHKDQILFVRRAIDPHKGMLDLFGGFVSADEDPEEAIVREAKEELGIGVRVVRLLGAYGANPYPYQGIVQYNCDLIYLLQIVSGEPVAADDVASFEWLPLDHLPYGEMAFPSQNKFLEELKEGKVTL